MRSDGGLRNSLSRLRERAGVRALASDATALLRPATVVRHRRHVGNGIDANTERGERTHRRFATGAGALDAHVERLDALVLRGTASCFGGDLRCERRRLARALEALATARCPRECGTLAIADRDDRVVEAVSYTHLTLP